MDIKRDDSNPDWVVYTWGEVSVSIAKTDPCKGCAFLEDWDHQGGLNEYHIHTLIELLQYVSQEQQKS